MRCIARSVLIAILFTLLGSDLWAADNAAERIDAQAAQYRIEACRWEEAGKIFRSDPRWLGGDGATSVDLNHGRVLWLFGDSFIDPSGSGRRRATDLVRNSIAVQTGYDPARAEMTFFWKVKGEKPAAFFQREGDYWFWPGSGIMVGKRLLIFLMEIRAAKNPLGFEACGWKAVWIENPQQTPDRWRLVYLISPQKEDFIVGTGSSFIENGFLKVFATDSSDRAVYLVRWPEPAACAGTLTRPQWWAGDQGWVGPQTAEANPCPIFADGQMEFAVQFLPQHQRYLRIQTLSLMNPCLAMSTAEDLTGPWSAQSCFFVPPEQGMPDLLVYAAKSHSMLSGADLVFTYVVNAARIERVLGDLSIYFPVMLRGEINVDGYPW